MNKILLIAILLCCNFSINATQIKDWAKYNQYADENKNLKSTPDVVFMGNSITFFWTQNDPNFFKDNNFLNRGISGQTTCEMLVRFRQDVINIKPKAVVILAGINDIAQNMGYISQENILGNIISMCELAKHNNIKVILCSILPCNHFSWKPDINPAQQIIELNKDIRRYATEIGAEYVDYYQALTDADGGIINEYSNDRCHPNAKGYQIMSPILIKAIKNTLR